MSTYIICANPWSDIKHVQNIVFEAFGIAEALPSTKNNTTNIKDWHSHLFASSGARARQIKPGKAWELAASEIFLSNWEQPMWGWADYRSTLTLDFWRDFDESIFFMLVHSTPKEAISRAINSDEFNIKDVVERWTLYTSQMLSFYNKYPEQCLLVSESTIKENSEAFMEKLAAKISKTPNKNFVFPTTEIDTTLTLSQFISEQLLQTQQDMIALNWDIEASLDIPLLDLESESEPKGEKDKTLLLSEALKDFSDLLQKEKELLKTKIENEELQNEKATLAKQKQETQEESELLLLQLHQVQEELESTYANTQEEKEKLEQELQNQKKAQDEALKAKEQNIATLQNEKATLAKQKQETQEESELLLLQLHQVQEELEHYFLKHKESEQKLQEQQAKLDKILKRYPDFCEYDSIEALSTAKDNKKASVDWRINGLVVADKEVGTFEVSTIVAAGYPAIVFENLHELNIFSKKPDIKDDKLVILPSAFKDATHPLYKALSVLSNSDWQLLRVIVVTIKEAINSHQVEGNTVDTHFWTQALERFLQEFDALPKVLRYDSLSIKNEQVNRDYEHLWFKITNLTYGQKIWSDFEFRLSAAMVKKASFSTHPKLEFPLINGKKPFDSWFEESEDDFGPKYELRFDTKANAMDIQAWQKLSSEDQKLLLSIVSILPNMLEEMGDISRDVDDWSRLVEQMSAIILKSASQDENNA